MGPGKIFHSLVVFTIPAFKIIGTYLVGDKTHAHIPAFFSGSRHIPPSKNILIFHVYAAGRTNIGTRSASDALIGGVITSYSIHYTKLYEHPLIQIRKTDCHRILIREPLVQFDGDICHINPSQPHVRPSSAVLTPD